MKTVLIIHPNPQVSVLIADFVEQLGHVSFALPSVQSAQVSLLSRIEVAIIDIDSVIGARRFIDEIQQAKPSVHIWCLSEDASSVPQGADHLGTPLRFQKLISNFNHIEQRQSSTAAT